MSKINIGDEWWTSPTESPEGKLVIVTGRDGVEPFRQTGKYTIRVTITWMYDSDSTGMPNVATSKVMEAVTDNLKEIFAKDPVAVMTGIYTGAGERNWVFYTRSLPIFDKKLNEALAEFELLPIKLMAEEDDEWAEYDEMREASEIVPEE
jgi:hypothetical protein